MNALAMEIRSVDGGRRTVVGVVVPYDETSYLTPNPNGERIRRGAFTKSVAQRATKVFLNREHDEKATVGRSVRFDDGADGLVGEFHVRASALGDETLAELTDGYWPGLSLGFKPLQTCRGPDGATEVVDAYLGHVALTRNPAYLSAEVLELRRVDVAQLMAGFGPRPQLDLSPIPALWEQPGLHSPGT